MPRYLVDGILHVKYKLSIYAESDIGAKQAVKDLILKLLIDPSDEDKITIDNQINPTVEVIQP